MLDVNAAIAQPTVTRRDAYRAPEWLVPEIALDFDLDPAATRVLARLDVVRNSADAGPLRLDGDGQQPVSVTVDGIAINDWSLDGGALIDRRAHV